MKKAYLSPEVQSITVQSDEVFASSYGINCIADQPIYTSGSYEQVCISWSEGGTPDQHQTGQCWIIVNEF